MSSEADAPEAPAVDEARQGLLDRLTRHLGDAVLASHIDGGDIWVRIDRARWQDAARICRDELDLRYFCFLGGIDWLDNPGLSGEKVWDPDGGATVEQAVDDGEGVDGATAPGAEPEAVPAGTWVTGVVGGDTRFQVILRLYSIAQKLGLTLKVDLDGDDPRVDSIAEVFRGADWHEREAWEMYGFQFDGHPGLRHLYLPGEFEGYPLRKDFPLLAREVKPWPGLVDVEPMPGEPEGDAEATEGAEA